MRIERILDKLGPERVAEAFVKEAMISRILLTYLEEFEAVMDEALSKLGFNATRLDPFADNALFNALREIVNIPQISPPGKAPELYALLPRGVELNEDEATFLWIAYRELLKYKESATTAMASDILAAYMYAKHGDVPVGYPFGELAWYLLQLAESYGIEPDRVVGEYECYGTISSICINTAELKIEWPRRKVEEKRGEEE
jgi:hypothetical protein